MSNSPISRETVEPVARPKLLLLGKAGHGKTSIALTLGVSYQYKAISSSAFAFQYCGLSQALAAFYPDSKAALADKDSARAFWKEWISMYTRVEPDRLARQILEYYDLYEGMRSLREFEACQKAQLFDYVIWVEAGARTGLQDSTMEMRSHHADFTLDNNGTPQETGRRLSALMDNIMTDWAIQKALGDSKASE